MTKPGTDSVLFMWLLFAGMFGVLFGVPWSIAVLSDSGAVWLSAAVEFVFFLAPASAAGVWLGKKVDLDSGLWEWISGIPGSWKHVRPGLLSAMIVGLVLGGFGIIAQGAIPKNALIPELNNPNTLEWFLRCLSAALTEEIFFRFGLMTFFVWMLRLVVRKATFNVLSLWIGNLLSATVFAGAHLPQLTFNSWSLLIPFVVVSSGTGMIMGWLYIRYGLISAIVAHFIIDLIVYVIPGLLSI